MKKVLIAVVLIALLVSLCACSVPSDSFMSKAQVNSLVKRYGEPKAELTLDYKVGNDELKVTVTYKLLLDKAPIAVTRFIQLANAGAYDDTVIDTLDTSLKYMVMGRYKKIDSKYNDMRTADVNFAGEFKSNDYREPKGGYTEFKIFSLAMYHEDNGEHFNSANGTLILALAGEGKTLNSANYAVFAEFESMTVSINGGDPTTHTKVSSSVQSNLMGFNTRAKQDVYDFNNPDASAKSVSMISNAPTLTVKILGEYDWSKLPTIR